MGREIITVHEMFEEIHTKNSRGEYKPFTISFFTLNKEKRAGGKLMYIPKALSCRLAEKLQPKFNMLMGIRDVNNDAHDITVHIPLIHEFNGKRLML